MTQTRILHFAIVVAVFAISTATAMANVDDNVLQGGAWHFKSVQCTDTTVAVVEPRLKYPGQQFTKEDFRAGVYVGFNTGLGLSNIFPREHAAVATYSGYGPQAALMMAEKRGDKVQVCFLESPLPYFLNGRLGCNPDVDSRGRTYRVYDYHRRAAYYGGNSTHGCGGA